MSSKEVIRIPRPKGLTTIAQSYNSESPTKTREKLQSIVIQQWINSNMMMNGVMYSIDDMAAYLNMTSFILMRVMQKELRDMNRLLGKDGLKEYAGVLFFTALKKITETEALSRQQVHLLLASQGDGYQAFISSTVNQALSNLANSQKPYMELLRILQGPGNTNILNLNTPTDQGNKAQLGTDEAIMIIRQEASSLLEDPNLLEAKFLSMGELPDVNGRNQDLTSIGIKSVPNPNPTQLTSPLTGSINEVQDEAKGSDNHDNRSAKRMGAHEIEDANIEDFIA